MICRLYDTERLRRVPYITVVLCEHQLAHKWILGVLEVAFGDLLLVSHNFLIGIQLKQLVIPSHRGLSIFNEGGHVLSVEILLH